MKLPTEGKTRADVMASLDRSMAGDLAWEEGRTFSLAYGAGPEHLRLLREAYALFMATNGLGAGRYLGRQLTTPPSLHVVLTPVHAPVVDDFLRDLREVAGAIGRSGRTGEKRSNYAT